MTPYLLIEPIQFGELQEKQANAITWMISSIQRGAISAIADCSLIWEDGNGNTVYVQGFSVPIDNATLQAWGADDTVIDDAIIAYSPMFVKRTT